MQFSSASWASLCLVYLVGGSGSCVLGAVLLDLMPSVVVLSDAVKLPCPMAVGLLGPGSPVLVCCPLLFNSLGVSKNRGPKYSTLNSSILIIQTPKYGILIFGNWPLPEAGGDRAPGALGPGSGQWSLDIALRSRCSPALLFILSLRLWGFSGLWGLVTLDVERFVLLVWRHFGITALVMCGISRIPSPDAQLRVDGSLYPRSRGPSRSFPKPRS